MMTGHSSAEYFVLHMLLFLPNLIYWKYFDIVSKEISRNKLFESGRNHGFLLYTPQISYCFNSLFTFWKRLLKWKTNFQEKIICLYTKCISYSVSYRKHTWRIKKTGVLRSQKHMTITWACIYLGRRLRQLHLKLLLKFIRYSATNEMSIMCVYVCVRVCVKVHLCVGKYA